MRAYATAYRNVRIKLMRTLILVTSLIVSLVCQAAEAGLPPSEIEKFLNDLAPHARNYPPHFDSEVQRDQLSNKLKDVLATLDAQSKNDSSNLDLLFRHAFANSMGHNLDFSGCAEKAISSYETLLEAKPQDGKVNFYFGAFLAGTTLLPKSVPYLRNAADLGVTDAHYTLAFVYLKQGDLQSALPEFKAYLKFEPDNETAKKMVSDIEGGRLRIKIRNSSQPGNR